MVLVFDTECFVKKRHKATLELIFARPVHVSIRWADIQALFAALGTGISEPEGSRVSVFLFGEVRLSSSTSVAGHGRRRGCQHSQMAGKHEVKP